MSKDLEEMLNEVHEEPAEDLRTYIHCPLCSRRMWDGFFQGHVACHTCRGVTAQGVPVKAYIKEVT